MFKKYYKEANNDINADEAFINSVIEKAQKKRVPSQKSYYKYALTAAAAVVVLSATAVTMPLLTDNNSDGVISVVTQTAQPQKDEVLPTPTHSPITTAVPNPPQKVKETSHKALAKQGTNVYKEDTKITEKKEVKIDEPSFENISETPEKQQDFYADKTEEGLEISGALVFSSGIASQESVTADTADSGELSDDSAENRNAKKESAYKSETDKTLNSPSAGGGAAPAGNSMVVPPQGYRISESGNNKYVFVSESGAVITVIVEYTNGTATEPVYSGLNVTFTANGMKYNIFSDTAEKTSIDELVNSLR